MPRASFPSHLFEKTVDQAIEELVSANPERGIEFEDDHGAVDRLTFVELERQTARVAGALQARGLPRGCRIVLVLPQNQPFIVTFLGAIRAGLIPAPISPPLGFGGANRYLETVSRLVHECGAMALVIDDRLTHLLSTLQQRHSDLQVLPFDALSSDGRFVRERASMEDICFLQFTSGSTGPNRGVLIRHRNVAANTRSISSACRDRGLELGKDPAVWWLPLFHDMGLMGAVLCPLYVRNSVRLLTPLTFLKRPQRWLEAISRTRAAVSFAPNFAYAQCARRIRSKDLEGLDLSCWKVAGCGAEPIRPRDLRDFARRFAPVGFDPNALTCAYGLAEATVGVSFDSEARGLEVDRVDPDVLQREGRAVSVGQELDGVEIPSCGRPLLDMEVQAFAPEDLSGASPLDEREVGELRLRGPSLTSGYWGGDAADPGLFAGEWLRTGDLGYLADGRVHVCGRLKDTLIINGRNYQPQEVEWAAAEADGVFDRKAAAFSLRPEDGGERVIVLVETIATDPLARQRIGRGVKRRIFEGVGLTVAEVVAVRRGALPTTTSGKLQRFRAREMYIRGELTR